MFRILGTLLLIGAVAYLCRLHVRREEARVRQCEGLLLLVRHIRTQISCFRLPLTVAVGSFENEALEHCGFLPLSRERGLGAAISVFRERGVLSGREWRTLADFTERVGDSYTVGAISLCEYTERELAEAVAHRRAEAPARCRVGQALLIFGGLSFLLLFG